jgi:hypothetical protein
VISVIPAPDPELSRQTLRGERANDSVVIDSDSPETDGIARAYFRVKSRRYLCSAVIFQHRATLTRRRTGCADRRRCR